MERKRRLLQTEAMKRDLNLDVLKRGRFMDFQAKAKVLVHSLKKAIDQQSLMLGSQTARPLRHRCQRCTFL